MTEFLSVLSKKPKNAIEAENEWGIGFTYET